MKVLYVYKKLFMVMKFHWYVFMGKFQFLNNYII